MKNMEMSLLLVFSHDLLLQKKNQQKSVIIAQVFGKFCTVVRMKFICLVQLPIIVQKTEQKSVEA